jgi:hypothetical protein
LAPPSIENHYLIKMHLPNETKNDIPIQWHKEKWNQYPPVFFVTIMVWSKCHFKEWRTLNMHWFLTYVKRKTVTEGAYLRSLYILSTYLPTHLIFRLWKLEYTVTYIRMMFTGWDSKKPNFTFYFLQYLSCICLFVVLLNTIWLFKN